MLVMTYDQYEDVYSKMESLKSVIKDNKGLTEADLERLKADPEKYMAMIIYFLTRDFSDDEQFSNEDALPGSEVKAELNRLIKENVEFVESL